MTDRADALRAAVRQPEWARDRRAIDVETQALDRLVHQRLEELTTQTRPQPATVAQAWRRPTMRLFGTPPG